MRRGAVMWGRQPKVLLIEAAETGPEIKQAALGYLRTHRKWYARWSLFYSFAWNGATLLIVILGALSSILTATQPSQVPHWLLITLPAVSSLLAAVLMQFRLKDACRLRELGRIATEELICKAHLIPTDVKREALVAAITLREAAHRLEREQLVEFLADTPQKREDENTSPPTQRDDNDVRTP